MEALIVSNGGPRPVVSRWAGHGVTRRTDAFPRAFRTPQALRAQPLGRGMHTKFPDGRSPISRSLPRRERVTARAAAVAAAGGASTAMLASTPFKQALLIFVQQATLYIGTTALVLFSFNIIVEQMLKNVKEQRDKVETERSNTFALEAMAVALQQPVRVLLPLVSGILTLREGVRFFFRLYPQHRAPIEPLLDFFSARTNDAEKFALQYSELMVIVILTWLVFSAKATLFRRLCTAVSAAEGVDASEVERALNPVADLISWTIGGAAIAASSMVVGINIQPLLVTGGIGGAIAALASQSFLANIVSGINLFLSRPFVVGDRIKVSGSINVHGIVEEISYTRTLVRIDQLLPVLIPNKALQEAVIVNESRAGNSATRSNYTGPRNLNFQFHLPFKHMDQAPQITAEIRRWLREECDLVDNRYALYCWVTALGDNTAIVTVNCYSTTRGSRNFAAFREEVLGNIFRIVREFDASIASYQVIMDFRYDMGKSQALANGSQMAPWVAMSPKPNPQQQDLQLGF